MADKIGPVRTGRPADPSKRSAILSAARRLMVEREGELTIDSVAEAAGVARQTVYNGFGSKDDLIEQVIRDSVETVIGPLAIAGPRADVRETLRAFGQSYADVVLGGESIALLRAFMRQGRAGAVAARKFHEAGPLQVYRRLSAYFADAMAQGLLAKADPDLLAEQFFGLLRGARFFWTLVFDAPLPDAAEVRLRVDAAVETLLRAYGCDASSGNAR